MASHTLYAYAIGSEWESAAELIESRFKELVESRRWLCPEAWPVNQVNGDSRDVGMNLVLPEPYQEPTGWFTDVEAVVGLCWDIHRQVGVSFVIGASDGTHAEDIIEVGPEAPNVAYLQQFLG